MPLFLLYTSRERTYFCCYLVVRQKDFFDFFSPLRLEEPFFNAPPPTRTFSKTEIGGRREKNSSSFSHMISIRSKTIAVGPSPLPSPCFFSRLRTFEFLVGYRHSFSSFSKDRDLGVAEVFRPLYWSEFSFSLERMCFFREDSTGFFPLSSTNC